jgi:hypothetical protein
VQSVVVVVGVIAAVQVMDQRVVLVGVHQITEGAARPTDMAAAIFGGVERRRWVDVVVCARLQELHEGIAVPPDLTGVGRQVEGDVEQRRRAVGLAAPVCQKMRQGILRRGNGVV